MKKLATSFRVVDLKIVQALLNDHGIETMTDHEALPIGIGNAAAAIYAPELWIVDDRQFDEAQAITADFQNRVTPEKSAWKCPACGTLVGGQFTACWNCSTDRASL